MVFSGFRQVGLENSLCWLGKGRLAPTRASQVVQVGKVGDQRMTNQPLYGGYATAAALTGHPKPWQARREMGAHRCRTRRRKIVGGLRELPALIDACMTPTMILRRTSLFVRA
jgi:hypothetical protein